MITAKEAAAKSYAKKTESINQQDQFNNIMDSIKLAAENGNNSIYLNEELLGENKNRLNELGYSYGGGYGVDCKSWCIHW